MSWDDDSGNKNRKNPWGQNTGRQGPSGGGPNGPEPPDLDELARKMRQYLNDMFPGLQGGKLIGLGVLVIVALWLATGFYIVEPGEHGVVQRFGAWERTQTQEGLGYHYPWPIGKVQKVQVDEVRRLTIGFRQIPGRTDKQNIQEESLMLTSDANIVDLEMVVLWNIKSAENFLFNIKEQENTLKKVAESSIREIVGQTPMFPIITKKRGEVAAKAKDIMISNLDQYKSGVNITQVLIQDAEVHPDVQNAFQDVQSARQDALDIENRAQAFKQDILPKAQGQAIQKIQEAEGYKQSVISQAKGEAGRFEAVYEAYLKGKDVTKKRIYIETMEDVLGNAQKIIVDDKNGTGVVPFLPLKDMMRSQGSN